MTTCQWLVARCHDHLSMASEQGAMTICQWLAVKCHDHLSMASKQITMTACQWLVARCHDHLSMASEQSAMTTCQWLAVLNDVVPLSVVCTECYCPVLVQCHLEVLAGGPSISVLELPLTA